MPYQYDPTGYGTEQPFQRANAAYEQASTYAMPSMESRDRAAARVRSRVNQQRLGDDQTTNDMYQRRGLGGSGMNTRALGQNRYAAQQAYGSGLADMEDDFVQQQQKGADIYSQIGAGYAQMGEGQAKLGLERRAQDSDYDTAQNKLAFDREDLAQRTDNDMQTQLINSILALGQAGNTEFNLNSVEDIFRQLTSRLNQRVTR